MKLSRLLGGLALAAMVGGAALAAGVEYREDQAPGDAAAIEAGKKAYAMCVACHGEDGAGRVGMGPRLNSASYLSIVSNDFLKRTIVDGRKGTNMIGWGATLKDDQVDGLVALIRSWQTKSGVELNEAPLAGTAKDGEKLYKDICSRCHGRAAGGYAEAGSGTGIGRLAFLDQASNGMLRAVIKEGKDNTAMRSFAADSPVAVANLSDEEIDSIIQYLRAEAW